MKTLADQIIENRREEAEKFLAKNPDLLEKYGVTPECAAWKYAKAVKTWLY